MKRIITLALALAAALAAMAGGQADIAGQILKKNGSRSYTCTFKQAKYLKMMKKEVKSEGTLYTCKGNMAMRYTEPEGDYLVINDKQFVMQTRGRKLNHNIQKGSPLLTLRNTLLYCMHGDLNAIATENGGELAYVKEGDLHVFSVSTAAKGPRGYRKVTLKYNAAFDLREMTLEEVNGNYTVYTLAPLKEWIPDTDQFTVK